MLEGLAGVTRDKTRPARIPAQADKVGNRVRQDLQVQDDGASPTTDPHRRPRSSAAFAARAAAAAGPIRCWHQFRRQG
jgi:hypothetical protein